MNVGLIYSFTKDVSTLEGNERREISNQMKNYFKDKIYGKSIEEYIIGINCVSPEFASFFKAKRPFYTEDKDVIVYGNKIHIHKSFSLTIVLNYNDITNRSIEEGIKLMASEIIKALSEIKYPKKIKDFDQKRFYQDMELFFKEQNLI
jgi:hypothetical protein